MMLNLNSNRAASAVQYIGTGCLAGHTLGNQPGQRFMGAGVSTAGISIGTINRKVIGVEYQTAHTIIKAQIRIGIIDDDHLLIRITLLTVRIGITEVMCGHGIDGDLPLSIDPPGLTGRNRTAATAAAVGISRAAVNAVVAGVVVAG